MKRLILLFLLCYAQIKANAQPPNMATQLRAAWLKGNHLFKRNLSFNEYHTSGFRRTLGSLFHLRAPSLINGLARVHGIPLYHRDRYRAKDVFSFDLKENGVVISHTECRSYFRKNETFHLFGRQDSSFFGKANTDGLHGMIQVGSDTCNIWEIVAANLNGSREEEQGGVIYQNNTEIRFALNTMLLRDHPADDNDISRLLLSDQLAYTFSFMNEVVAAVSFRKKHRKIWLKQDLDPTMKTVIISACSLLTFRRNLYH